MKKIEWVIAIALVVIGLSCLTMSANWLVDPNSIRPYLNTLLLICLWAGIPVIIVTIIYFLFIFIKKKKNNLKS